MIVAKRKPFDEIMEMLKGRRKVMVVGCGTCVAVCLAGGEKEVAILATELDMARKLKGEPVEITSTTLERQCDREYLAELDRPGGRVRRAHLHGLRGRHPVSGGAVPEQAGLPGRGHLRPGGEPGRRLVRGALPLLRPLRAGVTGGICPVTMCAKGLYNGPCGGTNKRQLRDQRGSALRLERHLRPAQSPGPAGLASWS